MADAPIAFFKTLVYWAAAANRRRPVAGCMRAQEGADVAHRKRNLVFSIFPGIDGHLGVRGEAGYFHRDLVRVRRHVIRRYQQRRLDGADEIARHREDEVGGLVYMLVRKSWIMSIVTSGRRSQSGGPQPLMLFW